MFQQCAQQHRQVAISLATSAWHVDAVVFLQAVVPRSSKKERIAANRALEFVLSAEQMQRIDALDGTLQMPTAR